MNFHPWRWLRAQPHLVVVWQPQPAGRLAATDGRRVIYMDPRQSQAQRRCAITHEQIHVERAHVGGCNRREERAVRAETARRLIALPALVSAYRWTRHPRELAEELWVTTEVLCDRLDHLTRTERAELMRVQRETERGA